jgi:mRNA interferase RelE/StbE
MALAGARTPARSVSARGKIEPWLERRIAERSGRSPGRLRSPCLPAEAVAWACYEFIRGPLAEEPHRVGAPLRAPFEGHWRARRGEYRVRYTIDEDAKVIHVLDVDHRRDIYHR